LSSSKQIPAKVEEVRNGVLQWAVVQKVCQRIGERWDILGLCFHTRDRKMFGLSVRQFPHQMSAMQEHWQPERLGEWKYDASWRLMSWKDIRVEVDTESHLYSPVLSSCLLLLAHKQDNTSTVPTSCRLKSKLPTFQRLGDVLLWWRRCKGATSRGWQRKATSFCMFSTFKNDLQLACSGFLLASTSNALFARGKIPEDLTMQAPHQDFTRLIQFLAARQPIIMRQVRDTICHRWHRLRILSQSHSSRYHSAAMDDGRERLITHSSVIRRHPTWRTIVIINTTFAGLLLVTYLAFLIWIHDNLHVRHGVVQVFSGTCPQASKTGAYASFATCTFAVLLFAAGSHGVQLLLSPARNEVENAHSRDRWVHIGVGGLRNVRWISKRRLVQAILLVTTSILLPYLHNSMVFTTLATTDRVASLVTVDYLKGSRLDAASEQSIFLTKAEQYHAVSSSAKAALTVISFDDLLEQIRDKCLPNGFVDCELHYPEMAVDPRYQGVHNMDWFNTNGTASIFHFRKHCLDTDFDFGTGNVWNVPILESSLASLFACLWSSDAWLVWHQAGFDLLVCYSNHLVQVPS
ncbi:hypothetical protein KCV07_g301, partial [Aureobasidium melanogenum]